PPRRPMGPQVVEYHGPVGWFVKGSVTDKVGTPLPGVTVILEADGVRASVSVTDANGRYWLATATAPSQFTVVAELAGFGRASRHFATAPSGGDVELTISPAVSESITVTAEAPLLDVSAVSTVMMSTVSVAGPTDMPIVDDIARVGRALDGVPLERRHELVLDLVRRIA